MFSTTPVALSQQTRDIDPLLVFIFLFPLTFQLQKHAKWYKIIIFN